MNDEVGRQQAANFRRVIQAGFLDAAQETATMNASQAADRWARRNGYADFDTYIRAGGGILEVRERLVNEMRLLRELIEWVDSYRGTEPPHDTDDETPDPHNAHIQGAEEP